MGSPSPEELAALFVKKFLQPNIMTEDEVADDGHLSLSVGNEDLTSSSDGNVLESLDHGLAMNDSDLYLDYSMTGGNFREQDIAVPDELPVKEKTLSRKAKAKLRSRHEELSPETKRELDIIAMRHNLDPKRHYKASDWRKGIPQKAQIGTVIADAADFYSSRLTRRERPKSLVDELLRNEKFRKRSKQKYLQIQKERARRHKFPSRHQRNKANRR